MSMYFFGVTNGHLNARATRIAERHGAQLINYQEGGGQDGYGVRRWATFAFPQRGDPYDAEVVEKIEADIERSGGMEALRKKRYSKS